MAFGELHYWNDALGKQTSCNVILPQQGEGPFPVFYLLHGYSDDHTMWVRRSNIERYVQDLPLIVVMPDGGQSFYCDAVGAITSGESRDNYETAIVRDLIGFVDSRFRTRAERSGRVIAGLSMGGYGALKLALKFPDLFCAAASHSGSLRFSNHGENDGEIEGWLHQILVRLVGENPDVWAANDLFALAAHIPHEKLPALRIDCGTDDFIIEHSREFHAHLKGLEVSHEYDEFPGGHDWNYWDTHIQETIAFFQRHLGI